MKAADMDDEQYGLLFDVRRSIRYHDRRRAFFEVLHRLTNVLTILMAGSVLFEIGRSGASSWWLVALSAIAAILAACDMVIGYSTKAALHFGLKKRFGDLEISITQGGNEAEEWAAYRARRLMIEQDEPPVYRALDLLCHNEMLAADNVTDDSQRVRLNLFEKFTSQLYTWPDIGNRKQSRPVVQQELHRQ